mmetsp:Transcript_4727/g.8539  ORF Transcript_4727/g.8539 Transcript_4727/m.8539 type:complete len:376 (-) Transcript_4727:95-1222(-)
MQEPSKPSKWVFSAEWDFFAFTLPTIGSLVVAPYLWWHTDPDRMPLAAYLVLVVFTDVGHVWTTIFRTYMDSDERSRRPLLYWLSPPVIFLLSFALHYLSPIGFWTVLGYCAIYHFMKQFYGWMAIYKGRCMERWDWALDKWVIYGGALLPCAYWHADPERSMDWFHMDGPLVVPLPQWTQPLLVVTWVAVLAAYFARQGQLAYRGQFNAGKSLLVLYCYVTWAAGVLIPHKMIALCFLNLIHAFPSYLIIFFACQNKYAPLKPVSCTDRLTKWFCTASNWPWYIGFFCLIAFVEELLWDCLVWHEYTAQYLDLMELDLQLPELGHVALSAVSAALTLPQAVHYWLDTHIWKMGPGQNPGLKTYLGLGPKPSKAA